MGDPLLDPPDWQPDWLPSVHEPERLAWFRRIVYFMIALGFVAMLLKGASSPADPYVDRSQTSTAGK